MTPLEVLQVELDKYQRALNHLELSFLKNDIPKSVYDKRKQNLELKIQEYVYAIKILEYFIIPSIT